ncbi:MAG: metalloregulator ArsR/SmtB family transcription factor [Dehalococcoidia bacterium]|nr:metalloregulator ArsR/SmtB family transcription factor [Dehalococcoidia bacterium]
MGLDDVMRALSDPTRREVVRLLARSGPMSAGDLAERFDLAKSTMSGHFNTLRQAGLIVSERQGASIVYSASLSVVEEAMATILNGFGIGERRAARDKSEAERRQSSDGRAR